MKQEFVRLQSEYKNQNKYMNKMKTEKLILEKELDKKTIKTDFKETQTEDRMFS